MSERVGMAALVERAAEEGERGEREAEMESSDERGAARGSSGAYVGRRDDGD